MLREWREGFSRHRLLVIWGWWVIGSMGPALKSMGAEKVLSRCLGEKRGLKWTFPLKYLEGGSRTKGGGGGGGGGLYREAYLSPSHNEYPLFY